MLKRDAFERALKTLEAIAAFPGSDPKCELKVTRGTDCDHAVITMTGDERYFNEAVGGMLTMSASIIGALLTASTVDGIATWTMSVTGEPSGTTTDEVADRVFGKSPAPVSGTFPGPLRPKNPSEWVFCGVSRAVVGQMYRWVHEAKKVRVVSAITADRTHRLIGVAAGSTNIAGSTPSDEQVAFAKEAFGVENEIDGETLGIVAGSADDCAAWFTMQASAEVGNEKHYPEVVYDATQH